MATIELNVIQPTSLYGGNTITSTDVSTVASGEFVRFKDDGQTVLYIENTGASASVVTIASNPDEKGAKADLTITVPITTGKAFLGPFDPAYHRQNGYIQASFTNPTGVKMYAISHLLAP